MSEMIRRRSIPDSLRWLAGKLESGTLTEGEQAGVALTLRTLADEASSLMDDHAHELAERLRNVHGSGEGDAWNWWDAAEIPGACADLIDPKQST